MIKLNSINQSEAIRYMGYGNNKPDEKIQAIIDEAEQSLLNKINARYLYSNYDITIDKNTVIVKNTTLRLGGQDIVSHLIDCEKVILMCATLSSGVDMLIRTAQVTDLTKALVLDALASAAIEQVCNEVDEIVAKEFNDYYHTWRFSPGYGDLPIDIQTEFLNVLDAPKKIGLTVNGGNILVPTKSVTAIIGLSKTPLKQNKKGCASCNLAKTCNYRKRGEHCGF